MARLLIPPGLQEQVEGRRVIDVPESDLGAALFGLRATHPRLAASLTDPNGTPRRFVRLYLNGRAVDSSRLGQVALSRESKVQIMMALAGG